MASTHEQRVLDSYENGGNEWVDILFEDYPYYDDDDVAPKRIYVLLNSLQEMRGNRQKHRLWVLEKIEHKFGIIGENRASAEEFYEQFTREELIDVGI
uniref:Uncharacterized protein n=1 Tax=Pithovirus LCPAC401 TaxID=2506595 RepID=A0A481ZAH8_9VIRU|nr:MAG: uncharacterized protein LCPAC401_02740 [Pithovirus LCPAC401]